MKAPDNLGFSCLRLSSAVVQQYMWCFISILFSSIYFFFNHSTVEASVHGSNVHCTDKTIEAAEALLHMESPTCLRDARSPGMSATASAP